jgi:transcriptional regulator with PAS, ATPase and Fis domain
MGEAFNYLRIPSQLLQAALDNPFEGTVIIDDKGIIHHFSRANEPFYDITSEDAVGRRIRDIVPQSGLPEVLRSGKPLLGETFNIQGRKVIVNNYPIKLGEKTIGAVGKMIFHNLEAFVTLQRKIGELESTIRRYELEIRKIYRARYTFDDAIGNSTKLRHAKDAAKRLAASASPILLMGESGAGKEIFAHAIHQASPRKDRAFVRVNCASIPNELFESELFGYKAGAFTGALKSGKQGKFELAHRGTIFLDEIGEMPLALQAKLLRVLQEKEIEPLGSEGPRMIDFRVIAATNRDLEERVRDGYFRRDLFYRLNVISFQLPSLREMKEDIPTLAEHFMVKLNGQMGSSVLEIDPEVMEIFRGYDWPGNVRELENVMERALALCQGPTLKPEHLPENILQGAMASAFKEPKRQELDGGLLQVAASNVQKEQLLAALQRTGGNRTEAAALLNIHRTTLYFRLRKYGLTVRSFSSGFRELSR